MVDTSWCGLFFFWTTDKTRGKGNSYMWVSVQWKTKNQNCWIYAPLIHWVVWRTGTPNDRDEINRREFWVCDGWVCDLEAIGDPSIFNTIRSATTLVRMLPTLDLRCEENVERRKLKLVWTWRDVCHSFRFLLLRDTAGYVRGQGYPVIRGKLHQD